MGPGFDSGLAMACIEDDLEAPVDEIYDQLDRDPISAASLGQVHRGVLMSGQAVAVKVQRPGLREQITLDLYIVRNIAAWLNSNIGLIRSDLVALIDELGRRVFEEMDYLNEASNAETFAELHQHNPRIAVPTIYRSATSRRVLTMEWIDGVKLTNLDAVRGLGVDPDDMVEVGVNCSLQQLLEHGFFHHVVRVYTELANRIKVGELDTVDPLHRQHPAAGGVAIDRWNSDARVVLMQL